MGISTKSTTWVPSLIISGGQTGADRGALIAARSLGIPTGGFAPSNFWTEAGRDYELRDLCGLMEMNGGNYADRTEANVGLADAVVLICRNFESRGSLLTASIALKLRKPIICVPCGMSYESEIPRVSRWLSEFEPQVLMVAGNRESVARGIEEWTVGFLCKLFREGDSL